MSDIQRGPSLLLWLFSLLLETSAVAVAIQYRAPWRTDAAARQVHDRTPPCSPARQRHHPLASADAAGAAA